MGAKKGNGTVMAGRNLMRSLARTLLRTGDVTNTIRRKRLAIKRRFYRSAISLSEIRELFRKLGFERDRVVWVQSSWNEFYNLSAKPSELLELMLDMLGPKGTLVMPAFPIEQDPGKILEIDFAPSSCGLLSEIFRRHAGVVRSIHLSSSVCAHGPAADYLVRDHHREIFAWGKLSPFVRLSELDARLVCLGLGRFVTNLTPLHSVECLLYEELPFFRQVFEGTITYEWKRRDGDSGTHEFRLRRGRIKLRGYGRHFPRDTYVQYRVSNLDSYAIDAATALNHAIALARRGITIYVEPRPRPELFIRDNA
jgi:aminoglycoside N3'-acetyltransferase